MRIADEANARAYIDSLAPSGGIERLAILDRELRIENERQNLVARNTLDSLWQRHIADSAQLLEHVVKADGTWLDLGSGAGFPGLVIAALRPEISVILVESRSRRVDWLKQAVAAMGIENCHVEGSRLELVASFATGVISARAFAPLDRLLRLSARFSTSRTRWVLPKGRSAAQEVAALPEAGRKMFHVEQSLTDDEAGIVVGTGKWSENA